MLTGLRIFFTARFINKFAVKWILKIPPRVAYVAALPREPLVSANEAINDKLQGSVGTYLRCGGVVNTKLRTVYVKNTVKKNLGPVFLAHPVCKIA